MRLVRLKVAKKARLSLTIVFSSSFFLFHSFDHTHMHIHSVCCLVCSASTYKLHVMCLSSIPSKNTHYFGATFLFLPKFTLTKMHLLNVSICPVSIRCPYVRFFPQFHFHSFPSCLSFSYIVSALQEDKSLRLDDNINLTSFSFFSPWLAPLKTRRITLKFFCGIIRWTIEKGSGKYEMYIIYKKVLGD